MPMFPDAWMSELLAKTDFSALVGSYVPLRPKGGRLWGCCPFHNEKTPSFSVVPDKQFYYCFGCHAGGGPIQFVMEMEKLNFVEAVKWLAQRVGMELPGEVDDTALRREHALRERIYSANKLAAHYYHDMLLSDKGKGAQSYLLKRGLDARTVKRFGLGYAAEGWENLTEHLLSKDFSREELIRAGLAVKGKKNGECYDAFRNRIIFPIIDTSSRILGFGARTMGDETPKYLNTGDTPVYNKRSNLYGLNLLKRQKLADIIMVEGYMDVIRLVKAGVSNCVAGLGTALTQNQARLLKRYVPLVYLCYDGDSAGQNAALRGIDILAKEDLDVRVIVIPGGLDPDDYLKQNGKEAFFSLKEKALPRNAFKLETMAARYELDHPDGREGFAREACTLIGNLEPVEQERYMPFIARKTGLSESTIRAQCGLAQRIDTNSVTNYRHTKARESVKNGKADKLMQTLLACMLHSKEGAAAVVTAMADGKIAFPTTIAGFADRLLGAYMEADALDIALLLSGADEQSAEMAAAAQSMEAKITNPEAIAKDCVTSLRKEEIKSRLTALSQSSSAGDETALEKTMEEIKALQQELAALEK